MLSWRLPKQRKNQLKIRVVPYQVAQHYNVNPGTMCLYMGDLTPVAFVENEQSLENDYIEINSRDFMAALQRLLAVKYEQFSQSADGLTQKHDIVLNGFVYDFMIAKLIDPSLSEEKEDNSISPQIIRGLVALLTDESAQVREAALNTLGIISLPEAKESIEHVYKCLSDQDPQIRAMAAWCLGRMGEEITPKIAKKLVELLKDSYWKVRTAACVAIGAIGQNISDFAF